jgi:mannan endo-1,4-beta-mannosidase
MKTLFVACLMLSQAASAQEPVTPNASPEARALLHFFYSISGEYLLTGQHNYPNVHNRNTLFAAKYAGKTPVIYSTDWGFAKDGNSDSYLARQDIVREAIRQNKLGSIITLCWHAAPPTATEPVTFQPLPGADPNLLQSVQGKLLDQQFQDVLTPGTALYKHWCDQVDTIAVYLKELQDAHVPVLWRPYHEMNGDWFWWGGRQGTYNTDRLFRQLFERLVRVHHLNNLVWEWNVDRPSTPARHFSNFFPGAAYFDIASLDVYGSDFNQAYYDSLLLLARGKPIVLGEVGNPPSPQVLKRQPRWGYYVIWAGMVRNTLKAQYAALLSDSHVLSLEDTAYWAAIAPYRAAAGLPPLTAAAGFDGEWIFDEASSTLGGFGTAGIPGTLDVSREGDSVTVSRTLVSEFSDPVINKQSFMIDGTTARISQGGDTLTVDTKTTRSFGGRSVTWEDHQVWTLQNAGRTLAITQTTTAFNGKRTIIALYHKN